jgi:beta-glucosidase
MKDNESLTLTFDLKNVGLVAGAEITQFYVSDIESIIFRPEKELKGFAKVFLQPNEVKNVSISLNQRAFAFYNVNIHDWCIESGDFEILVGSSSQDIKLSAKIYIISEIDPSQIPNYQDTAKIYYTGDPAKASASDFEVLLGCALPPSHPNPNGPFTLDNTFGHCSQSKWGSHICSLIHEFIISQKWKHTHELVYRCALEEKFSSFDRSSIMVILKVLNGEEPTTEFFDILKEIGNLIKSTLLFV